MHRLLKRQIERHAGGPDAVPSGMQPLIVAVDEAYHQFDTDRAMLERSLELSSGELLDANRAMRAQSLELERSNGELEEFAYVASHDLQEPLRTIQSYLQLFERRHGDLLDGDAREFIDFAIGGAVRMRQLITDLLAYARVSSEAAPFEPTDVTQVVDEVVAALKVAVEEAGASVVYEKLPNVAVDKRQIAQLFQNLIANAIKFRRDGPPQVIVRARRDGEEWRFSVEDNGIGMEPKHAEKIFVIFKRLHGRDDFAGTGIGLAICKKIVERHGGRIWVESETGSGSTFLFTIPVREDRP
ncbi:MAG: ATP-binding protein [Myxococcota bacterium]